MTTLLMQEFPGAPGGMNVALPQQELDDTEARVLQDILVDYPGLSRRRGLLEGVGGLVALTRKASGLAITLNPLGQDRYGVFTGDAANGFFEAYSADFSAKNALAWPHPLPAAPESGVATAYRIFDIKPALGGGTMQGVSSAYDANSPNQGIAFWKGGINANGSGTITVARGSAAVTGTGFNAALTPGMWIFAATDEGYTGTLIGCVLSVNSDVSLTLTQPSPYALTAKAATYQALRGLYPQITKGRLTCDTSSATVNGGATKFVSQGLTPVSASVGIWNIYRQSDFTFVGRVKSVQSETSLTLGIPAGADANAAIAMSDEQYIAIRADADYSIVNTGSTQKVGFLNAVYSERQWYANLGAQYAKTNRLWFTDIANPEALDVTNDGDWLDIDSTSMINEPIKALIPAYNSLVVIKENETFGLFGSTPTQFSVRKIHDDGTLSGMSVQPYGGGAIWAGRDGIHYYDGIQVQNLTQLKLGDVWKNSVRSFDPTRYRMWSMVVRNHYMLFIENLAPTLSIVKGNTSSTPSRWGICINMATRAITMNTNLNFRGSITLPASSGKQVWFIVNDGTKGIVCDTDTVFDSEGVDSIVCDLQNNMITNGDFETNITGWTSSGSGETITWDTTQAYRGSGSLKLVSNAITGVSQARSNALAVTSGVAYTGSAFIKGTAGHLVTLYASDFGGHTSAIVQLALNGEWQRVFVNFTPVTTGNYFLLIDTQVGGQLAETVYVDRVRFELGSVPSNADPGPDFFFESKKFDVGESLRLKRFKQLAIHYLAQGGALKVDTVLGLNNIGTTLTSTFPASVFTWDTLRAAVSTWDALKAQFATWNDIIQGVFIPKRVRFLKRSQHFSFRLYQENPTMSRVKVGPYSIGFKMMRPGRV